MNSHLQFKSTEIVKIYNLSDQQETRTFFTSLQELPFQTQFIYNYKIDLNSYLLYNQFKSTEVYKLSEQQETPRFFTSLQDLHLLYNQFKSTEIVKIYNLSDQQETPRFFTSLQDLLFQTQFIYNYKIDLNSYLLYNPIISWFKEEHLYNWN